MHSCSTSITVTDIGRPRAAGGALAYYTQAGTGTHINKLEIKFSHDFRLAESLLVAQPKSLEDCASLSEHEGLSLFCAIFYWHAKPEYECALKFH